MKVIELNAEEFQEFDLGQIVEVPQGVGIIAAFAEENFEYPAGSKNRVERIEEENEDVEVEQIEASEESPVYIVALQNGGSVAVTADEISTDASLEGDDGKEIESWEKVGESADEAELAPIYSHLDDPTSYEELKRVRMMQEVSSSEELVNIPGVDDPHVGFDELPPGWTRKSVLQAWASLGGTWRTAYARMIREMGPRMARKFAASMKDEVLRTEEWRNSF